ncbi:hypothetical protein LDENG_00047360 [Lucifuga dentata]|nr:hypothetical protein LDENG_00047360 [Lucifuga dentata]
MKNQQIISLLPILALAILVLKINGSVSLHPELTGPDMAYLGSKVAFRCISPESSPPINYLLMKDSDQLIDRTTYIQANKPATFLLKVTMKSEGSYYCKAKKGRNTKVSSSIRLFVVTPVSGTRVTFERFPPVAYEGTHFVLTCDVTQGSHLSYTWFFNRKKVTSSTSPLFHLEGNKLVLEKVTVKHAGNYSCMAGSRVQDTNRFSSSGEVYVTVKVNVSTPRISFSISKEGANYSGNVTCWSSKGSRPVTFYLLLDDKEVSSVTATESLVAWFPVSVVLGQDMGVVRCRVKNEVQDLMSEPLTLEVVPVGGHAKVEVEYLYRADSKVANAKLHCEISRGTFPFFTWVLNDSIIPSETNVESHIHSVLHHYVLADRRRTLILNKLGPEQSGYYRCRARDSYDNSTPWVESAAVLVQVTGFLTPCPEHVPTSSTATPPSKKNVFLTTIEAIAIAFCCFLLLALVMLMACVYRKFDHRQVLPPFSVDTRIDTANPQAPAALSSPTPQSAGQQMNITVVNQTIEITV